MIHKNSKESFAKVMADSVKLVYDAYDEGKHYTDREIATKLGKTDMNAVRPRVNELLSSNHLVEIGSTKDSVTNRTVRVCMKWVIRRSK